jgi:hypothetical protein
VEEEDVEEEEEDERRETERPRYTPSKRTRLRADNRIMNID